MCCLAFSTLGVVVLALDPRLQLSLYTLRIFVAGALASFVLGGILCSSTFISHPLPGWCVLAAMLIFSSWGGRFSLFCLKADRPLRPAEEHPRSDWQLLG